MTVRPITKEVIWTVTRDPRLFSAAPFLQPLQAAATQLAAAYPDTRCKSCTRTRMEKDYKPLQNAFIALIRNEHAKSPNMLENLKQVLVQILGTPIDKVQYGYRDEKGVEHKSVEF